jgi:hypothetical protein
MNIKQNMEKKKDVQKFIKRQKFTKYIEISHKLN